MQKCIEVMSNKAKKGGSNGSVYSKQIDFIIDDVMTNVEALSCHPYGCRVLQRMLEHCVDHQRTRVLDKVSSSHRMLLDDQYGNYVIQHVLQFGRNSDRDSILGIVVENGLLTMSRQKFASNVVEKLLKYGSASQRNAIVREMLKVRTKRSIHAKIFHVTKRFHSRHSLPIISLLKKMILRMEIAVLCC